MFSGVSECVRNSVSGCVLKVYSLGFSDEKVDADANDTNMIPP